VENIIIRFRREFAKWSLSLAILHLHP
jgi:hypothetical protein